jgi:hypothetical protein
MIIHLVMTILKEVGCQNPSVMTQSRQGTIEETQDIMLDAGLIRVQPKRFECTSIETREWLNRIFGTSEKNETNDAYHEWLEPHLEAMDEWDHPQYVSSHTEYILEWLE